MMRNIAANRGRRDGVTLVEVLVSIFLMGIGMLALLTLFPIGVLRMQQAMNDDRYAQASICATALANARSIRSDSAVTNAFLNNPPDTSLAACDPEGRSYAVVVDPAGWLNALGATQSFAGGEKALQRILPSFIASSTNRNLDTLRGFAVNDELPFLSDEPTAALPSSSALVTYNRNTTVSWAYVLQRPRFNDASNVEMAVVVFKQRPLTLSNNLTPAENAYPATYDTTKNLVTLDFSAPTAVAPNLNPGDWILDCSVLTAGGMAYPHAWFYKVTSVTPATATSLTIEVQTPLRGFNAGALTAGRVMVIEGVAEVFEKGVGRLP